MPSVIKIKKGLDLKLKGNAEHVLSDAKVSKLYSLKPVDFHGITPKLLKKEGESVKAGEPVFYSKSNESLQFVSPVSGEVKEIKRGAKRRILEIIIESNDQLEFHNHGTIDPNSATKEEITSKMLENGTWTFLKQRPYDVIANPEKSPKAIFVQGFDSSPLAADFDFVLEQKKEQIQIAITALSKLTEGKVYFATREGSVLQSVSGVESLLMKGPHPAGNASTQIEAVSPVNKGETVYVVSAFDLPIIGETLSSGQFNAERVVAITGSQVESPKYIRTRIGASLKDVLSTEKILGDNNRFISGNVLTGRNESIEGNLGYYHNSLTVIEEGDDYDFFGWNLPRPNKFSMLRAGMFSFLTPNKKYSLNTNTNGEERAFVLTGHFEKVFPMDIYPMQLLKAIMVDDLDDMESLGIYEVAPEDFALTEFLDVSKNHHQEIVRKGLDLMIKEIG